jgi:hypothetical protein
MAHNFGRQIINAEILRPRRISVKEKTFVSFEMKRPGANHQ